MSDYKYIQEGKRLREIRKIIGVSVEDIAEKMSVMPNSYRQIEQGKAGFSMKLIKTMAIDYNVSIDWLLLGQGNMFTNKKKRDEIHFLSKEIGQKKVDEVSQENMLNMIKELQEKVAVIFKNQEGNK